MKTLIWAALSVAERKRGLARPAIRRGRAVEAAAARIIADVRRGGDRAVATYSRRFDKAAVGHKRVGAKQIDAALRKLPPDVRAALETAHRNIATFHTAALPRPVKVDTMPGVQCELQWRPLDTVGIYIPGGTAPLFSTLLMQAIPARIAGCRRIVVCTPPGADGKVNPYILAAAKTCGIDEIYGVGGAQAIAAMAFGTKIVPRVDKIFGPGNAYVTAAKQLVAQDPGGAAIDMPAGPSEVMVIADGGARADWVAADLLAQAEHDSDAQAMLVTTSKKLAADVAVTIEEQVKALPRKSIAQKSLKSCRLIVVSSAGEALEIANAYAAEHLILNVKDAARWWPKIQNAGSVFIGPWSPESAGDYASGTNHVLPTAGYARVIGGLSVLSFMKSMTAQTLSRDGLARLGPAVVAMAEAEGLHAHATAVRIRLGAAQ